MKHPTKKRNAATTLSRVTPFAIGLCLLITVFVIANYERLGQVLSRPSQPGSTPKHRLATTSTQTLSAEVYRVASMFVCTCGACGEKPLESCDCPKAVEERTFIRQQLETGRTESEVAEALDSEYGGRKAPGEVLSILAGGRDASDLKQGASEIGHLAGPADRDHIISHFKCPCEQCAIDELRDCECPHQRGAQEVKQFIDTSISKQQYTVGEIVSLVEQQYGGRIR